MNKNEFGILIESIKSAYNKKDFLPELSEKKLWYEMLKDMDYLTVSENLRRHIRTNKYAPTVAELRGAVDTKDFNNFKRRAYNMDALESELLEVQHREFAKINLSPYLEIEGGEYDSEK